jgi:hypothetical protein
MEDAMNEMTHQQLLTPHASNGRPAENDDDGVKLAQAMRRALKRAADYAMRHGNAAEAANEALAMLRAEFVWRFELLRSRQRQPVLIVPAPLPLVPGIPWQSNA